MIGALVFVGFCVLVIGGSLYAEWRDRRRLTRASFGCALFVAGAIGVMTLMACAERTGTGVDNEATYCARLCAQSGGVLVGWHVGHRTDCVCAPAPDGGAP